MKPLVGGHSCQAPHLGTIIKGVLHVVSDDGSEIIVHAGEAYVSAPGHDAWVVGDEEVVAYEFGGCLRIQHRGRGLCSLEKLQGVKKTSVGFCSDV